MLRRITDRIKAALVPLLRDTRGAAAIFMAVGLIPLIGAVGLAVDSSLAYMLKSLLSKSLDTAALAAGRVALSPDAPDVARRFFDANFGDGTGAVTLTEFDFELDPKNQFVTLTAQATAPTYFMHIFGHDTITVNARSVIQRQTTGMELALVLDNTGSMRGSAFNAMQKAAQGLVDVVFGEKMEVDNVWVSLVPFVATVNIGPTRTGWLKPTDRVLTTSRDPLSSNPDPFLPSAWKGCVMARPAPHDGDDAPPSVMAFDSFFYASTPENKRDNFWPPVKENNSAENAGTGPNLGCGPAITPLTASKATIDAGIKGMAAWSRGGTTGNLGLSWGWRTISPRWRGLWGSGTPDTHPLDYDTPMMEKVVVLLTDGDNKFYDVDDDVAPASDYTAYGRVEDLGVSSVDAGRRILDDRMAKTCAAMKSEGVMIYSITFGSTPGSSTQTLFRTCASSPGMYFHAPSNKDLEAVFKAIAGELANLRIVE